MKLSKVFVLHFKSIVALLLISSFIIVPFAPVLAQEAATDTSATVVDLVSPGTETTTVTDSSDGQTLGASTSNPGDSTLTTTPDAVDETLTSDPNIKTDGPTKEEDPVNPTDVAPTEEEPPIMMESSQGQQEFNPENLTAGLTEKKKGVLEIDETTGAFDYEIPIIVPPGRNGMQPDLKLKYNNQQANNYPNLVGYGWNLNIPYIDRINKTGTDKLYTDNYFNSSISGELVFVSGTTYAPKVENGDFLKYNYDGTFWTITNKSGAVYKFGQNASSRQDDPNNNTKVYKWMLSEVRDTNDNYIKYEYYKDAGQIYPSKIKYTGNGTTDGIFEVNFLRQTRADITKSYASTFLVTTNYRISEVQTVVRGRWVKKYAFAYTTGDNGKRSLLSSVTESGQDENGVVTTLPATSFTYYTSTPDWTLDTTTWTAPTQFANGYQSMLDINGDSLPDIIESYKDTSTVKNTYINNNNKTWSLNNNLQPPILFRDREVRGGAYSQVWDQGVRMGDVNSDLLPDIIKSEDNENGKGGVDAYLNTNGSSWNQNTNWLPTVTFNGDDNINNWGGHFIDLNGDGLLDVIGKEGQSQLNTGVDFATETTNWDPGAPDLAGPRAQFVDVNSDSLPDVIYMEWNGSFIRNVYVNKGDGSWILDNSWIPPLDLIEQPNNTDRGLRFFDVNNDGLVDAVPDYGYWYSGAHTHLNTGIGWVSAPAWDVPEDVVINYESDPINVIDVNNDGSVDFFTTLNSSPMVTKAFINNTTTPTDTLKKITFSQGGNSEITYKKSSKYVNGTALLNPNLPINLDTVYQVVTTDNNGNTSTDTYSYEGGLYYYNTSLDRKFAGFAKVTKADSVGNKTVHYFHQGNSSNSSEGEYDDHVSKIGKMYRTERLDGSGNFYTISTNKFDKYNLGVGRDFVRLLRSTIMTYDGNGTHKDKSIEYTYDDTYGNLTQKVSWGQVSAANDGSFTDTGTDKFTEDISYAVNTSNYVVGLSSQSVVTDQNANKVRESKMYYDALALGQVGVGNNTKTESWKDGSNYINKQSTYNTTYGLVTSSTDERGKVTNFSYDLYNIYPAIVTNPLNQVVKYFYDYSSGYITQKNDLNSKVYQYFYDGLDRILEEKISTDIGTPPDVPVEPRVKALVIAGGGSGGGGANGSSNGGGGGAGGYQFNPFTVVSPQAYTVTVGAGGRGGYGDDDAKDSTFASITAIRGGQGGYNLNGNNAHGYAGGSGGGGGPNDGLGGVGSQGNNGGFSAGPGGGGGGAGVAGTNGVGSTGGAGGNGLPNPIAGSTIGQNIGGIYYVAGGGGGYGYNIGVGGQGGGGAGGNTNCANGPVAGSPNTGGGGGGACWSGYGANGGSGVVIISYATDGSDGISPDSTGGTITTSGGQTIHTFTSNGTFTLVVPVVNNPNPSTMVTKNKYVYTDTSGAVSVKKTAYLDDSNLVETYSYFDGLGRLVQERREMENTGDFSVTDTVYNNLGLVLKESLLYTSAGSTKTNPTSNNVLYTNYTHDALQRPLTVVNAVGTTGYVYDDWKTTVTDARGKVKNYFKDAYDNLVQVDELNNGDTYTTLYEWNGNKNLTKITDALSNVRNFSYDGLGRRLTAEDLHAVADTTFGLWSYSYDDAGNMTQSTSPEGKIVNYTYDDINRILTEDETIGIGTEVAYAYDSCQNGVGKLCTVTMISGADTSNTYDALGNLATEVKTINGNNYTTSYTYDRFSNILNIVYPDNAEVKYTYNTAGQLEKIERKEDGGAFSDVVSNFDYGPHGKILSQVDANGVNTTNTYDGNAVYRLTNKLTQKVSGPNLQDITYTYDANGNITKVVDASGTSTAKTVDYVYDDLNRMTSATATNVASGQSPYTHTYVYDALGNITSGPVGAYVYDGANGSNYANPHAATSVNSVASTYDKDGNLLTNGVLTNTWNYKQQLAQSVTGGNTMEYWYDHSGQRVRSKKASANTYYANKYYNIEGTGKETKSIYAGDILVATFIDGNTSGGVPGDTTFKTAGGIKSATGWANFTVARLNSSNNSKASCNATCDNNDNGQVGDFSFSIPANATINGIEVVTEMSESSASGNIGTQFSLSWNNGTSWTAVKSATVDGTADLDYTLGNATDNWGRNWTIAELDNANFRLKLDKLPTSDALNVDFLRVKVYYTTEAINLPATLQYVHTDHLNSTNVVTDDTGAQVELLDYFPYGNQRISTGSPTSQRKYIGQMYDADTSLNYLNARYYDGNRGQFISQDPVHRAIGDTSFNQEAGRSLELHLMNPQALNSYSYANNNPVTYSDPSGKIAPLVALGIIWAATELGLTAYDGYNAVSTVSNPNASASDKSIAVGGFVAGLGLPGGGYGSAAKAIDKVTDVSRQAERLHDSTVVCRGGTCSAERFESASGVLKSSDGTLSNISVTSRNGASEADLVKNLPGNYSKYGATTVGNIRSMGGDVIKDLSSKFHSTINGLNSKQLESLFTPTKSTKSIKN